MFAVERQPGRLPELIGLLALAPDPADRGEMLLSLADAFTEVPPEIARRPFDRLHQVPACESEAYVWGVLDDQGGLKLYFAVENPSGVSAKALATILDRGLSGVAPGEIARVDPDIVFEIFRRDISMGKGLGLMSMVRAVQTTARQAAAAAAAQPDAPAAGPRIFPRTPDQTAG